MAHRRRLPTDEDLSLGFKEEERRKNLARCQRDLWFLATEYLDYGWNERLQLGLVEDLHKPVFRWYNRHDQEAFVGIWGRRKLMHKTTFVAAAIIQNILRDPCSRQGYFHAVDELAADLLDEVGNHLQKNDKLRSLEPIGFDPAPKGLKGIGGKGAWYKVLPAKTNRRWKKVDRLTVNRHRYSRFPTLMAKGAGSEVTGAHFSGPVWLDDIIARRTIENSELQKIARWVQSTVMPVSSLMLRSTGTPWAEHSVHQDWMESKEWVTLVLPAAIEEDRAEVIRRLNTDERKIHFKPDYKFTNVMFWPGDMAAKARKRLRLEQREMKNDFSPQIMCDSEPESEKPWGEGCEHFCAKRSADGVPGATEGEGIIVVLSDPAPFHEGSYTGGQEKVRADGTKDLWSICVVRIRNRVGLRELILLDGAHSLTWTPAQGLDVACSFMRQYETNIFVSEDPKKWHEPMIAATRRNGVHYRREKDGGPLKYEIYNRKDRKVQAFTDLANLARDGGFYICEETCPEEYLHGDKVFTGFLTQARKARPVDKGKWSLRFDDDIDVVSRAMDPIFHKLVPERWVPSDVEKAVAFWGDDTPRQRRSRYCAY